MNLFHDRQNFKKKWNSKIHQHSTKEHPKVNKLSKSCSVRNVVKCEKRSTLLMQHVSSFEHHVGWCWLVFEPAYTFRPTSSNIVWTSTVCKFVWEIDTLFLASGTNFACSMQKYKICKLHCLSHFRTWENLYLFLASGVNFPCVIRQCTKSAKLRAYSFCIYHISQPSFAVLLTLGCSPMLW